MPYIFSRNSLLKLPEHRFTGSIKGMENLPKNRPYIIAANHDNSIDAYILMAPLTRRLNKKIHVFSNPVNRGGRIMQLFFKSLAIWWAEVIVVDKTNRARSLEVAKKFLDKGELVGIFPETIDTDERHLARGKTGMARLALTAKVLIVPVGMYGGPNMEGIRENIKYFLKRKDDRQHIRIGEPIDLSRFYGRVITYELLAEATIHVMQAIAKLCGKEYGYTKRQWMEEYRKHKGD